MYKPHIFCIHVYVVVHLDCFHILTIVNNAVIAINVQVFVWHVDLETFGKLLGHMEDPFSSFEKPL